MLYVGLDLHTKHLAVCVLNETGPLVQRARVRGLEEMLRLLEGLPDRFEVCYEVCYEASCGCGHYHDLLQPLAARVLVAHPGQLRLIFRSCVVKRLMWRSAGSIGRLWGSARLSAT
jgi:hypothetical protein